MPSLRGAYRERRAPPLIRGRVHERRRAAIAFLNPQRGEAGHQGAASCARVAIAIRWVVHAMLGRERAVSPNPHYSPLLRPVILAVHGRVDLLDWTTESSELRELLHRLRQPVPSIRLLAVQMPRLHRLRHD